MIIDEKFAKYILSLQSIAKLERGLDENYDIPFRDKLEKAFPNLKEKRESDEFENWLLTDKIFNLPEIKTLVSKINSSPFSSPIENHQEKRIKELDAKKEKYYNLFCDDPKIKKEYKLLKTIKKLSS